MGPKRGPTKKIGNFLDHLLLKNGVLQILCIFIDFGPDFGPNLVDFFKMFKENLSTLCELCCAKSYGESLFLRLILHTSCFPHASSTLTNLANKEGGRWLRLCRLNPPALWARACWTFACIPLPCHKAMPRGLLGLRQATAVVTAHPWESVFILLKILLKFASFFDPPKMRKMLPMSLPRHPQNPPKSAQNRKN